MDGGEASNSDVSNHTSCDMLNPELATDPVPCWAKCPILGSPPKFTTRQWQVMKMVGILVFFDKYDCLQGFQGILFW